MAFPGMGGGMGMGGGRGAGLDPQQMQEQQMVKYVRAYRTPALWAATDTV